ncbi:MAG: hypothetical protein LBG52_09020 [Candidatus Peribacteria bacterium]|nr:hypothetical protein [Candidatus Peribacteria bacterium]
MIAEKFADEKGLIRPENIAPYDYYIIKLGDEKIDSQALSVVEKLENAGKKVIYDDRDIRFGPKAKDADLLGIPHRIVVSDKSLQNNEFEYKARSSDTSQNFDVNNVENVIALLQTRKT